MPARPFRAVLASVGALAFVAGVSAQPTGANPRPFVVPAAKPLPRITFVAASGSSILLHGTYPSVPSPCRDPVERLLHARFEGTIEVGKDTDGTLFVVGELPFEDYLKGIAEVPLTWPMQALEAQVVAARTYALSHLSPDETGLRLGYQLCATDACQVYRGLGISDGPYGDRWRKAVGRTVGRALLYRGKPANTMFFSTSNGQTHGNDEIFGGAPLPYLRPVTENDDGASPLSHWRTSLPFGDVGRFLAEAGDWPSGTAITGIRRTGDSIVVTGRGTSKTLDVVEFRIDLNSWAHCLDPNSYPTDDTDGRRLPQTVPSRWFDLTTRKGAMTLTGRGWGHGVGMVQWGAEGKAARGLSYRDILADYYGGLRPVAYREPATIRVGVALGLRSVVVAPTGSVNVEGRSLGPGPWLLTGGTRLLVRHAEAPPSYIDAGTLRAGHSASSGQTRHATISIPETSVVRLVLHSESGDVQATRPRTYPTGSTRIAWTVPDVFTGTYRLQAGVTDGIDVVRTKGVRVRVAGVAPSPTPPPSPTVTPLPTASRPVAPPSPAAAGGDSGLIWLILSALAAIVIGVLSFFWVVRRSSKLASSWDRRPGPRP